ncbi:AraC family transcriptional regulator [Bradyrhizobium sp. ARR65]|uniref:AraC family transcriptional regulator n=1 Tax=Bradyrhizobium sp. ARR65 TaxID=1040989 RepID=UPI0004632F98|nr:AraC family transcriptional regulator [Bradyrhizobium sp. ARR65]
MLTESFSAQTGRPYINVQPEPQFRHGSDDAKGLRLEPKWRHLDLESDAAEDVVVSRWVDGRSSSRWEAAARPADRYVVGIALKTTRLKLTSGRQIIFDGIMPAGTLHVTAPARQLSAEFYAPCDFLHFHISADYLRRHRDATDPDLAETSLNDLILLRDSFAEQLGKTLIKHGNADYRDFTRCIGQALAMHLARLKLPRARVNALPKWRLRRVEDYVDAHLHRRVSLPDLARAANLSRMHFAAQFRTATGYRPREYLLHRRIERAKHILSTTEMPLAEVALAVGFCTQAHFSTVFKRITGETPARWRSGNRMASVLSQQLPLKSNIGAFGLETSDAARLG